MLGLLSPHAAGMGINIGIGIDICIGRNISRAYGQRSLKTNCAFRVSAEILAVIEWRSVGDKVDCVRACAPKIWRVVVAAEIRACRLPAKPEIVGYRSYHD